MELKHIVFFVSTLDTGGIENYLLRFLTFNNGLFRPTIICKLNKLGELEKEFRKIDHINIIPMDLGFTNLGSYYKLISFFKQSNTYSICDFTGNFSGLVMLVGRISKVNKRVSFYRNSSYRFNPTLLKRIYFKFLNSLVIYNSTKILSNSEHAFEVFFNKVNRGLNFQVINNGIDYEDFLSKRSRLTRNQLNIPKDAIVIGHTGRYTPAKNHTMIYKIAKKLVTEENNIYVVLCGKDTENFIDLIKDNSLLTERCILLGYRSDIPSVLELMDVFLFPSITEGQPNSLIEAMVMNLPFVASDIPSIRETIPEYEISNLVNLLDEDGFTESIKVKINTLQDRRKKSIKEWTLSKYNPNVLFNLFLNQIL
ncbi:MAG: glycosyltransferase [Flavobacteriales bacterium]